jgi:uncharacterized membrane protein
LTTSRSASDHLDDVKIEELPVETIRFASRAVAGRAALLLGGAFAVAWSAAHWLIPGVGGLPDEVARRAPLLAAAYDIHSRPGTVAMVAGALQFALLRGGGDLLPARRALHRTLGRVYAVAALALGGLGFAIAGRATGGYASHFAFRVLAVSIVATTLLGWYRIRCGRVESHVEWMTRSYAFVFTFVGFRVWLVLLPGGLSDPEVFTAAAWWTGFTHLAAAEIVNARRRAARLALGGAAPC